MATWAGVFPVVLAISMSTPLGSQSNIRFNPLDRGLYAIMLICLALAISKKIAFNGPVHKIVPYLVCCNLIFMHCFLSCL